MDATPAAPWRCAGCLWPGAAGITQHEGARLAKSFSPAGMAVKAYYGRGARTFGNPDGAVSGGGAYAQGGANPNGPNQGGGGGGGGPSVTFNYIQAATNSSGPYDVPNNTSLISGITRQPIPSLVGVAPLGLISPDPVLVNGQGLQVVGAVGVGPIWYWTICLDGTLSQIFFTDWTFTTVGGPVRTLRAADADFNNLFATPGFSI